MTRVANEIQNGTHYIHVGGMLTELDGELPTTATITFNQLQLTNPTNIANATIPYTYRYGFNGQERENTLNASVFSAEYWFYDGRLGRRWNTEPLIAKYPYLSSYVCYSNNPIYYVDVDGDENTIYLYWSKHNYGFTKVQREAIRDKANSYFKTMGLATRVVLLDDGSIFNFKMDKTDAVAIVADVNRLKVVVNRFNERAGDLIDNEIKKNGFGKDGYFETTPKYKTVSNEDGIYNTGDIIAIDPNAAKDFAAKAKTDILSTIAFGIVHGAGHAAGLPHAGQQAGSYTFLPSNESLMSEGSTIIKNSVGDGSTYDKYIDSANNKSSSIINRFMTRRYGTATSRAKPGVITKQ